MKVLIKNGLVLDPKNKIKDIRDILIENKKIIKIERNIQIDENEIQFKIDATGLIVAPAFVDLHPNFCDPGVIAREDLKTGSLAAAKGGYAYVVLGTENKPAPSEVNVIEYINKYANIMPINIFPCGAVTKGCETEEIADLKFLSNHGAIGFYDGQKPIKNKKILEQALKISKEINKPIAIFSEDQSKVKIRGLLDTKEINDLGLKNCTRLDSEYKDLEQNVMLALKTKTKIDLAYVTAKESLEYLLKIKKSFSKNDEQLIFAEVPAMNLILNDASVKEHLTYAKLLPPLRTEVERKILLKYIKAGVIDIISSNHTPITEADKNEKIKLAATGAICLEMVLGICGKELVNKKILSWYELIEKLSLNPAHLYNLDKYGAGELKIGSVANIVIFDPKEKWKVEKKNIVSKSKNTPLYGKELVGKVKYTISKGFLAYRDIDLMKEEDKEELLNEEEIKNIDKKIFGKKSRIGLKDFKKKILDDQKKLGIINNDR